MPPRRSHKKSRSGCQRCKLRKIKCNEDRPHCGNCVKHGVVCDFADPDVLLALTSLNTSTGAFSAHDSMRSPSGYSTSSRGYLHHPLAYDANATLLCQQPADLPLDGNLGFFCTAPMSLAGAPMILEPAVDDANLTRQNAPFFSPGTSSSPLTHFSASPKMPLNPMPLPCLSAASKSASTRKTELRLWHYFSWSAHQNAISGARSNNTAVLWLYDLPNMAISSEPYLLDAILSVAAAHMQLHLPDETDMATASRVYADSAVRQYKNSVSHGGLTRENPEAHFFAAGLLTISTMAARTADKVAKTTTSSSTDDASPHHNNNGSYASDAEEGYTLPLNWFRRFQDVQSIVSQSWSHILNSPTMKKILQCTPEFKLLPSLAASMSCGSGSLSLSFFGHLLRDLGEECQASSKSYQVYQHAVSLLNCIHSHPVPLAVILFPAYVSEHFLDLVMEKRPRALAILACFFALMKRAEPIWWLCKGGVKDEIMGIVELFEPGSDWWQHLEWPIRIALQADGMPISPAMWGSEGGGRRPMGNHLVEALDLYFEPLVSMLTVQDALTF